MDKLRDEIAIAAMTALIREKGIPFVQDHRDGTTRLYWNIARQAYGMSDAMLEARATRRTGERR